VKLTISRSIMRGNARFGFEGRGATLVATDSIFRDNNEGGVDLVNATGRFDRCVVSGNAGTGMRLDAGVFVVRNSFVFRNGGTGIDIFASAVGNVVEFNTIVDNAVGVSCVFGANQPETPFPNNIIVRNGVNTSGGVVCTYPNSILATNISGLNFVSPDVAPFDYHIQAGSIAIDAAAATTLDHDFDGDPRPADAADVGADEL
ncbi:MAG: right-handed parallel beta-helix repeat-containing protein, partial [Deltaproteobacteria bacterium]|nr:right-handed parallel beta-helix repeat-containing protein [Deltaproteobacteria bacterium]